MFTDHEDRCIKPASVNRNEFKTASRSDEDTFLHISIYKHIIALQAPHFKAHTAFFQSSTLFHRLQFVTWNVKCVQYSA